MFRWTAGCIPRSGPSTGEESLKLKLALSFMPLPTGNPRLHNPCEASPTGLPTAVTQRTFSPIWY
jgi:hypothetical protein